MNKRHSRHRSGLLAAIVSSACSCRANATSYTFTDLGLLGGTDSVFRAINSVGQVAEHSFK